MPVQAPAERQVLLPLDDIDAGVIEDARQRQRLRRRRAVTAALAALAFGTGAYLVVGGGGDARHLSRARPHASVAAESVLTHGGAYMGVACRVPNSIACDRVGLAVWLRRPAVAVSATVTGRTVKLNDPEWSGTPRRGQRTRFAGFLAPAGLIDRFHVPSDSSIGRWERSNAPSQQVRLRITYGDGSSVVTDINLLLAPGWG